MTPQHLAIVMEYAAGGNMLDHVNRLVPRTMSEADARWFYQQIIIAMDYCHRKVSVVSIPPSLGHVPHGRLWYPETGDTI